MTSEENAKLAVTGASGFIGRGVLEAFSQQGISVRGISRGSRPAWCNASIQWRQIRSYGDVGSLNGALNGAQFVLHLADDPKREANRSEGDAAAVVRVLLNVATEACVRGVILASSVYARRDTDKYGVGKRKAEEALRSDVRIPSVILRLPPVYGPGGRGGLSALAALIERGFPLPLGLAKETRHYLSRRNFCDLIQHVVQADSATWQKAAGKIFEPSDGKAISTRDLIVEIAKVQGSSTRLLPFPTSLLRFAAKLSGRQAIISGALDRLDVEPNVELTKLFGWVPAEQIPASLGFLKP